MTWSKPRTTGDIPPPCRAHSCTTVEHDVGNGRRVPFLYVFGGGDGPNYFNTLYVLNTGKFSRQKKNQLGEEIDNFKIAKFSYLFYNRNIYLDET